MTLKLTDTLNTIPHQVVAAASPVAQAVSETHWLPIIAIMVSSCSLIVSLTSVYVALKNNWVSNRETGKKALIQFYEYSKQAYDLALANIYGHEFKKEKYFQLLSVDIFVELEKAGRTKQVKDVIDDLQEKFKILLEAANSKEDKHDPDELLKVLFYIRQKCVWMTEAYTFRVYLWNLFMMFK